MADAAGQVAVGAGAAAAADGAGGNHADAVADADVCYADDADDANYAEEVINCI